jgi:hypothetical protein
MLQTISFNTGRMYSALGQRIVATLYDDGIVTFMDHDRGIDGYFRLGQHCRLTETEVMHWYDSGTCQSSARSWSDGMVPGGANAFPA